MYKFGSELEFICRIGSRGDSIEYMGDRDLSFLDSEEFELNRLSIEKNTYIASGFNTFTVKIKENE